MHKVLVFLVLSGMVALLAAGCNDQADNSLSAPKLATAPEYFYTGASNSVFLPVNANAVVLNDSSLVAMPGMRGQYQGLLSDAMAKGYDGVEIIHTDGQPDKITYLKAVDWDGHSPLDDQHIYRFKSNEDFKRALEISGRTGSLRLVNLIETKEFQDAANSGDQERVRAMLDSLIANW